MCIRDRTSGVSRADQLKADIAALQSRFAGSMTLWFSYTLDQCNTCLLYTSKQDCYICGSYKKRTRNCTAHFICTDLLPAGVLANLRRCV